MARMGKELGDNWIGALYFMGVASLVIYLLGGIPWW